MCCITSLHFAEQHQGNERTPLENATGWKLKLMKRVKWNLEQFRWNPSEMPPKLQPSPNLHPIGTSSDCSLFLLKFWELLQNIFGRCYFAFQLSPGVRRYFLQCTECSALAVAKRKTHSLGKEIPRSTFFSRKTIHTKSYVFCNIGRSKRLETLLWHIICDTQPGGLRR